MGLRLPDSWSNWNLKMLVFEVRGKPGYPEKNISEQRREPTTNSTHIWHRRRELNPRHIGGSRGLSLMRHPCYDYRFSIPNRDRSQRRETDAYEVGGRAAEDQKQI